MFYTVIDVGFIANVDIYWVEIGDLYRCTVREILCSMSDNPSCRHIIKLARNPCAHNSFRNLVWLIQNKTKKLFKSHQLSNRSIFRLKFSCFKKPRLNQIAKSWTIKEKWGRPPRNSDCYQTWSKQVKKFLMNAVKNYLQVKLYLQMFDLLPYIWFWFRSFVCIKTARI